MPDGTSGSIAYQEGDEPTVVTENANGEMVQDIELEKRINEIVQYAEKTLFVGTITDEEGEQFEADAEELLALVSGIIEELPEYEFTISIA